MSDGESSEDVPLGPANERYFRGIEAQLDEALAVAEEAKKRGGDPSPEVEIPVAKDMADRVENLLGIEGVAARVRELEGEVSREEAALELARDFAEGRVGEDESRAGKVEGAVRTAVALLTEGVVAAPIEGIDGVEFVEDGGTEFVRIYYAGPIRSAGGTAQALSVLVADYVRTLLGLDAYEPRSDEVERYAEEVELYDSTTGLQYAPKKDETRFIAQHCPVMLDGEATGDEEVSGYRNLERVATNKPRGGMCLVLAEGIAQKAPKIERYTSQLDDLDWPWLDDLIGGTIGGGNDGDDSENGDTGTNGNGARDADESDPSGAATDGDGTNANDAEGSGGEGDQPGESTSAPRPDPSEKYLEDLIAGRPVFGHPSEPGGFRLRYGRARNHGFATAGVHPATMHLVDDFLATGTQIKTERPGKAAGVVPVDSIDGPTVRLANGDVRRIDDPEEALEVRNGVEAILDLGEYLVNYGEFLENNHPLSPASYTVEWWCQDFAAAGGDLQSIEDSARIDVADPGAKWAVEAALECSVPLHPAYTYLWHDLSVEAFRALRAAVGRGERVNRSDRFYIADTHEARAALETLLVPHTQDVERAGNAGREGDTGDGGETEGWIAIPEGPARALRASFGFDVDTDGDDHDGDGERKATDADALAADGGGLSAAAREHESAIRAVNETAPFEIRERAPTRIGNRMGRPEKSEKRELSPAVHTLFPIREAGGNQRDVAEAADHATERGAKPGAIDVRVGRRQCRECGTETFRARCPEGECKGWTEPAYECPDCEIAVTPEESGAPTCPRCGEEASSTSWRTVDLKREYREALRSVGERENAFPILKGVKGLTSRHKTPEPIEKGILRAKHGVSTFKDGTVRYDMTDLPVTSVRPAELDVSVDELRRLGYEEDVLGDPLRHDDQLVELRVQDVVLSDGAASHLLETAAFVDDLLVDYYDAEPFYKCEDRDELVGELVFGMAPHTSAAVVGRIVGFTSAAVGYAHPYFHAAKRRNCDGDEDCVMLLMDGLLNFSKSYLPDKRGGSVTEDSRLLAFDPGGDVRFPSFGEFWDELETEVEYEGKFEKRTCLDEGWRTYAFDGDHRASPEPIEKAIRYQAEEDERLVRVETQFGRSIEITEHHSLFRYDDGIEEVPGADLSEGDLIVAPRQLDIDPGETTIDVSECLDDPYVFIDDEVEELLTAVWQRTDWGSEPRVAFDGGFSYRLSKRKLHARTLRNIADVADGEIETEPGDLTIGEKGSSNGIDRSIDVDGEFAWLLGMFAAEGSLSGSRPTIYNAERDLVDRVVAATESTLGCTPSVRWSNRAYEIAFPSVFRHVLYDLGFEERESYHPSGKTVPECILRADREIVVEFLRGLLDGDGTETGEDNYTSISFYTTSEDLKDGVVFLCHRLGLVANVSQRERDAPRRRTYTVSVSGGRSGDPLARVLDGEDPYFSKSLVVRIPSALMALREMDIEGVKRIIPKYLNRRENLSLGKLSEIITRLNEHDLSSEATAKLDELRPLVEGDLSYLRVTSVENVDYDGYLYDLQVGGEPIFTTNWLYAHNSMDAPLVMSSRIDPAEIDDEAHNMDVVDQYPREFYEATRRMADPGEVEVTVAEGSVGTAEQYSGFHHTHDTSDIALGPSLSAYKTLGSMLNKTNAQLEFARKARAVDETDVAERIIEYHFLPDLIGNLRAFSRQETRCLGCGTKYRRVPLSGSCRECGGQVNLTVHQGSVEKYIETATTVAAEYDCRPYTKQRLEILERNIESVFEDDTNKQSGIADFM